MKNISKGKTFTPEKVMSVKENQTINKKLLDLCGCHILLMNLDQNTDISFEFYAEGRIYLILKGEININNEKLINNELILFEEDRISGIEAREKR